MVDVVVGADSVVVVGGPSGSPRVSLDIGPKGQRGSQIYTGLGKPTDFDIVIPDVLINDLFINLKPSDSEYLYLYKYSSFNGIDSWIKVLRLIPNTVLTNPIVRFINGDAHTTFVLNGQPVTVKGLYFPLSALFPDGILSISIYDINVQHGVLSEQAVSSSVSLDDISSTFIMDVLVGDSYVSQTIDLQALYIRAFLTAKEDTLDITGYRTVNLLVTLGGRDVNAKYFDASEIEDNEIFIPQHLSPEGAAVVYLNNGNESLTGLVNESLYLIRYVDQNTVSLVSPASPTEILEISAASSSQTHVLLRIPEVII